MGRTHYLESSAVSRHCFWTKGAQKRFTGWSREKLPSTVWVHVFDDSELIGESFLSSLPLGWKQECFAAFGSRTRQFKSSIKVRYQRGKKRKKKTKKTKMSLMMGFRASLALFKIHTASPSDLAVETA